MSGIYISGMEMPKCCWDCACYHHKMDDGYYDYEECRASGTVFNDGYASVTGHKDKIDPFKARLENCPLVPVPDHGYWIRRDAYVYPSDLIDRDAYEYPTDLMDEPVIFSASKEAGE